jgi:hypothetical protein
MQIDNLLSRLLFDSSAQPSRCCLERGRPGKKRALMAISFLAWNVSFHSIPRVSCIFISGHRVKQRKAASDSFSVNSRNFDVLMYEM